MARKKAQSFSTKQQDIKKMNNMKVLYVSLRKYNKMIEEKNEAIVTTDSQTDCLHFVLGRPEREKQSEVAFFFL